MPLFGSESTTNQIDNTSTIDKKIGAENASVFQNDGGGNLIYTETPQEAFDLAEASVMAVTKFSGDALRYTNDQAARVLADTQDQTARMLFDTQSFMRGALASSQGQAHDLLEIQQSSMRTEGADLADKLVKIGIPAAVLMFVLGRALA